MSLRWWRRPEHECQLGETPRDSGSLQLNFYREDDVICVTLGQYWRNTVTHHKTVRLDGGGHKSVIDHVEDHGGWKAKLSHEILGEEKTQVFGTPEEAQYWVETQCRSWLGRMSKRKIER